MTLPLFKDFYFIVKTHLITLSDIEDIFFKGNYPNLLSDLAERNYQLYIVSTYGIDESADNFINQMRQVYYLHAEDLILQSFEFLSGNHQARSQIAGQILPTYSSLLPSNWRESLELPALPSSPQLLYKGKLPLGVGLEHKKAGSKTYRARFRYLGKSYSLGYYTTPEEAGLAVKQEMLKVKGKYSY